MTNAEKFKTAEGQTEAYKDFCKMQTSCLRCPAYCERTCAMCQFVWLGLEAPKEITFKVRNKMIECIITEMRNMCVDNKNHLSKLWGYLDRIEKAYKGEVTND